MKINLNDEITSTNDQSNLLKDSSIKKEQVDQPTQINDSENIDLCKIDRLKSVEEEFKELQPIIDTIVEKYCGHLNKIIDDYRKFVDANKEFSDQELENFSLKISSQMYYVGSFQELLGLKTNISDLVLKAKYGKIFVESKGTIKDKEVIAADGSREEILINKIYGAAERTLKNNLIYAAEILSAIRMTIKRRTAMMELSKNCLIKETNNFNK